MIDHLRWELIQVTDKGGIQPVFADMRIDPVQPAPEDARVLQLILADEDLEDLVEQSHGIDIGSRHGLGSPRRHLLRKVARVCITGYDGAPGRRKKIFIKLIGVSCLAGNVDFRHG
jgi:hypothetical protein